MFVQTPNSSGQLGQLHTLLYMYSVCFVRVIEHSSIYVLFDYVNSFPPHIRLFPLLKNISVFLDHTQITN